MIVGDVLAYDFRVTAASPAPPRGKEHLVAGGRDGGCYRASLVLPGPRRIDLFGHTEVELLAAINSWAAEDARRKTGRMLAGPLFPSPEPPVPPAPEPELSEDEAVTA